VKFAVLSDVHVAIPPEGAPPRTSGEVPLMEAVSLLAKAPPDELICLGDMVDFGTVREFDLCRGILAAVPAPLRSIPGNHDLVEVDLPGFRDRCPGGVANEVVDDGAIVRCFLNTCIPKQPFAHWYGELRAEALDALDRAINIAKGRPLLVFAHHPPGGTVRLLDAPMMTIRNSDALLDRLLPRRESTVVFTGHNHMPDVVRNRELTVVSAPALAYWPHAFLEVHSEAALMRISTRRVIVDPSHSPDVSSRTLAELRSQAEPRVESFSLRLHGGT
jgi:3',5'-cyclic-AMP phosphodiesterase